MTTPTLALESTLAVVAGLDMTSTALSNALFHLLTMPAALAALRAELEGFPPSRPNVLVARRVQPAARALSAYPHSYLIQTTLRLESVLLAALDLRDLFDSGPASHDDVAFHPGVQARASSVSNAETGGDLSTHICSSRRYCVLEALDPTYARITPAVSERPHPLGTTVRVRYGCPLVPVVMVAIGLGGRLNA
jgi:hypothetical protein